MKSITDRDLEIDQKIKKYSTVQTTQTVTITYYGKSRRDSKITRYVGRGIIALHAIALVFFSVLFFLSYIPATKNIVTMVLP